MFFKKKLNENEKQVLVKACQLRSKYNHAAINAKNKGLKAANAAHADLFNELIQIINARS